MWGAIWEFLVELAKGFGGDFLLGLFEPSLRKLLGEEAGHSAAVAASTSVVLALWTIAATLVSREFLRWLHACYFAAANRLRHRAPIPRFTIVVADLSGDPLGGRKRSLIREIQRGFRRVPDRGAEATLAVDVLNLPVRFAYPELSLAGRTSDAEDRLQKKARRWLTWCGADVLIFGGHQKGEEDEPGAMFLTFLPRDSLAEQPRPYETRGFPISDAASRELRSDIVDALISTALCRILTLRDLYQDVNRIRAMWLHLHRILYVVQNPPIVMHEQEIAHLRKTLADGACYLGNEINNSDWLRIAIEQYEAACSHFTRDGNFDDWIDCQASIAEATAAIGTLTADDQQIALSLQRFDAVLRTAKLARDPHLRANIEMHCGIALYQAWRRSSRLEFGEAAASAHRKSLQYYATERPEDHPALNALYVNLGNVLTEIGETSGRLDWVDEGLEAHRAGLNMAQLAEPFVSKGRMKVALSEQALGCALILRARMAEDQSLFWEAIDYLRPAVETKDLKVVYGPLWTKAADALGEVLGLLALHTQADPEEVRPLFYESVACYREILGSGVSPYSPAEYLLWHARLGISLGFIGMMTEDCDVAIEARNLLDDFSKLWMDKVGTAKQVAAAEPYLNIFAVYCAEYCDNGTIILTDAAD